MKWKTDVAKKGRQVKTASSISAAWEKARGIGGNLKSDSDGDAQNKGFLILESADIAMF